MHKEKARPLVEPGNPRRGRRVSRTPRPDAAGRCCRTAGRCCRIGVSP